MSPTRQVWRIMMVDLSTGECIADEGGWGYWNNFESALDTCNNDAFDCAFGGGRASGNLRFFPVREEEVALHVRGPWRKNDV